MGHSAQLVGNIISILIISVVLLGALAHSAGAQTQREAREPRGGERADPAQVREELRERADEKRADLFQTRDLLRARASAMRDDEIVVKFRGDRSFERVPVGEGGVAQALARFRDRDDVEYAQPNYLAYAFAAPNDPYYRYQWHLENSVSGSIHVEEAWSTSEGRGATVAVIDTGVAYEDYWDARAREWYAQAPDFAETTFVSGYDFVNNDSHPNDDSGHGTHVAGTIAQSTGNGTGVAGVAPKASIMPLKVLDARGSGTYADMAEAVRYAADNGADVINLSLGGYSPASYLQEAVRYAHNKGVTIVAAAGNSGWRGVAYPAAYDEYVIAVGATRFDEARARYSNYGAQLDFVAPGGDTGVDQNGDGYGDGILQQTFSRSPSDFGYYFYSGTSMAAPHVAGVAALLHAAGVATQPNDIESTLAASARDVGPSGWDERYGAGLIDAAAAVSAEQKQESNEPTQESPQPQESQPEESAQEEEPSQEIVFSEDFEEGLGAWQQDWQSDWDDSRREAISGRYSAMVDGFAWDAKLISPEISLEGRDTAEITFSWYIERSLDWREYLALDLSTDGGESWQEQARLEGNVDEEDAWHDESVVLNGIESVMLRFRGSMTRGSEDAYVDMIKVVAR